jgi:hypothetical protein
MSGRNNSNYGGRNYQNGRGRGLQSQGRGFNGRFGEVISTMDKSRQLHELGARPTAAQVQSWLRVMKETVGVDHKHWSSVFNPEGGQKPTVTHPVRPVRSVLPPHMVALAPVTRSTSSLSAPAAEDDAEVERNRQDRERLQAEREFDFKIDISSWQAESAISKKLESEIDEYRIKVFNLMVKHISLEAKAVLETKHGHGIFTNECPKALVDAIRSTFLGSQGGAKDNMLTLAEKERQLSTAKQQNGQTVFMFQEYLKQEVAAHKLSMMTIAGTTQSSVDNLWTDERVTGIFLTGLKDPQFTTFKSNLKYNPMTEPMPATLLAAVQRATEVEASTRLSAREDKAEKDKQHIFHAFFSGKGAGKAYLDNVKKNGDKKPIQRRVDADGKGICFDHADPGKKCDRGSSCRYSHKPEAMGVHTAMINKAIESQCGGGPGPAPKN